MTLLSAGEYDDLPLEAKIALSQVVRHPKRDKKSNDFRKQRGPYMNGELYGDPVTLQHVGYGTGSPLVGPVQASAPFPTMSLFPSGDLYPTTLHDQSPSPQG